MSWQYSCIRGGNTVARSPLAQGRPPAKAKRLEGVQSVSETARAVVQNVSEDGKLQSSISQQTNDFQIKTSQKESQRDEPNTF